MWAHIHQREGLLNGFRQPLRPTQQKFDAQEKDWLDIDLCFDKPPSQCSSCGSSNWTLDPNTYDKSQQKPHDHLIIITSDGG